MMFVKVYDNDLGKALRVLKRKMQKEGIVREMRARRFYQKPSEVRAREKAVGVKRARRNEKKRNERDQGAG